MLQRMGRATRRLIVGFTAGMVALSLTVVADAPPGVRAQGTPVAVSIVDFAFNPASVTVAVGGQVRWTNTGQANHTTTSQTGGWDSDRLAPGQTFTFTASRAGSFEYVCEIHPNMRGTVVVQAGAAPATAPAPGAAPAQQTPVAAPRTGTGITADSENVLPALALIAAILLGTTGLAYARRRT